MKEKGAVFMDLLRNESKIDGHFWKTERLIAERRTQD